MLDAAATNIRFRNCYKLPGGFLNMGFFKYGYMVLHYLRGRTAGAGLFLNMVSNEVPCPIHGFAYGIYGFTLPPEPSGPGKIFKTWFYTTPGGGAPRQPNPYLRFSLIKISGWGS